MASDSSGPLPSPIVAAAAAATTTVTGAPISSSATKMTRTCSLCGNNGHNSRTCTDSSSSSSSTAATGAANGGGGIMLFGVRVTEGSSKGSPLSSPFRKSASMTNLSQLDHQPHDSPAADAAAAGYASDDTLHAAGRIRERKRGVAWTENEHRLFLLGLQKVGKGDWRGISRNFVKTRTPTQVASHAQKYFLRRSNLNRRRRRSSLFDITTDTVMSSSSVEEHFHREGVSQSKPPIPPPSLKMADLNLNESPEPIPIDVEADESFPLSLSLPPSKSDEQSAVERRPAFPPVGFSGSGDGISVA